MENKKVIDIIRAGVAWANWTEEQKEAFIIAGEAVSKQIPYKLTQIDKETLTGICKCGRVTENEGTMRLRVKNRAMDYLDIIFNGYNKDSITIDKAFSMGKKYQENYYYNM